MVKAFNNIFFKHLGSLQRPSDSPDRSVLAIAGDDDAAKKTVTDLVDRLGYDAYDVGPLSEGWRYQRDTAAYATPYAADPGWSTARRVTAEELAEKLAAARRYRDM